MNHDTVVDLSPMNFSLLRKQKMSLCNWRKLVRSKEGREQFDDTIQGMLCLIDAIQDRSAITLGDNIVFGRKKICRSNQ